MVRQIKVGTMANFVYLIVEEKSRDALVVDSGWETTPIVEAASGLGAHVKYIVATHEHFDHVSTIHELAGVLGGEVVAQAASPVKCDVRVADGDVLRLGGAEVRVLQTPGHTEDSICLHCGAGVFTGDTLFVGAIGRFGKEKTREMYRSLYEVILGLPGETEMYPGHDYGDVPHRTLAEERQTNPYLGCRDFTEFLSLF